MFYNDAIVIPRYGETDKMNIIYHANYYNWFEVGRTEFFKSLGYPYNRLEADGILLPVIECSCSYIKPAVYDVAVYIRTQVELIKGVKIGFVYQVFRRSDDELLAKGKTLHAFVDKKMKPVKYNKLSKEFRLIIKTLKS